MFIEPIVYSFTNDPIIQSLLINPIIQIFICIAAISIVASLIRNITIRKKIRDLSNSALEVTPNQFFAIRTAKGGRNRYISTSYDFVGIYILYNTTKSKYYIGQSKRVFSRVNQHFTGRGNGDLYADYKYGDRFTIKMVRLENSGFSSLNDLERCAIKTYNAYAKGYNKTRGNR